LEDHPVRAARRGVAVASCPAATAADAAAATSEPGDAKTAALGRPGTLERTALDWHVRQPPPAAPYPSLPPAGRMRSAQIPTGWDRLRHVASMPQAALLDDPWINLAGRRAESPNRPGPRPVVSPAARASRCVAAGLAHPAPRPSV